MKPLVHFFALLLLFFSSASYAFTCVPAVLQWGTITYINLNQVACTANEWAIFNTAELAAYVAAQSASTPTSAVTAADFQALQAQVAALQASSSVAAVGNVFDPTVGAAFWSFAMTFVLGVFLISKNAAAIINVIKRL